MSVTYRYRHWNWGESCICCWYNVDMIMNRLFSLSIVAEKRMQHARKIKNRWELFFICKVLLWKILCGCCDLHGQQNKKQDVRAVRAVLNESSSMVQNRKKKQFSREHEYSMHILQQSLFNHLFMIRFFISFWWRCFLCESKQIGLPVAQDEKVARSWKTSGLMLWKQKFSHSFDSIGSRWPWTKSLKGFSLWLEIQH